MLVFAILIVLLLTPAATAHAAPLPVCPMKKTPYTGDSPRIQRGSVRVGETEHAYTALLPAGYTRTRRRYPVLYLLHGAGGHEDYYLTQPKTPGFLESLGGDVIVVMPDGGFLGMYANWSGEPDLQFETAHVRALVPHIDSTYRTRARRSQRAVAGISMGGLGALGYAARHPALFGAAGSFSGLLDTSARSPLMKAFLTVAGPAMLPACMGTTQAFGPWGDPVTRTATWEAHNPTALVGRLRRTPLYVATGDGRPCDAADSSTLATETPTNPLRAIEPFVDEANRTFAAAAREAGLTLTFAHRGCGLHSWRYWEQDLQAWWSFMREAFAGRAARAGRRVSRN